MDTGPLVLSFLLHASENLGIWRCEFSEMSREILCRSAEPQLRASMVVQQAPPLLIWAGGNSVHWPISISPLRCQAPPPQQYPAPLSRLCLLSDILLFFFLLLILFALNHLLRDIFRLPKCRFSKTSCFLEFHQRLKNKYIKMNATVLHTFSSLKENLHYLHPRHVFQS